MKKGFLFPIFLLIVSPLVFSGGKQEPFQSVEGKENWHYEYDIAKLEPGKYNLVIQAEDKAGNIRVEGPFNINIDPDSDIPKISINSPVTGWTTTGKLNVVGSAVDDDKVDFVEVQLVLDGQEVVRASGTRYWSHYFDLTGLEDGEYTIRARATDIKGVASPWTEVSFNLDQFKPVLRVTSHEMGSLVKGSLKIAGELEDPNGVTGLQYSLGSQENFQNLNISYNQEKKLYNFTMDLDTTKIADGSQVLWLKSSNRLGNSGISSFLFIVDNTGPEIQMLRPVTDEKSPGTVYIAGMVKEGVGLKSLSWSFDGKSSEIPLIPGNPYWLVPLNFSGSDASNKNIEFIAEDKIGNRAVKNFTVYLDREKDLPKIILESPLEKAELSGEVLVHGWVMDDDGAKTLTYNLEGAAKTTVDIPTGTFSFKISPKTSGSQVLNLTAQDINGLDGKPVQIRFTQKPLAPVIYLEKLVLSPTKKENYQQGFLLPAEAQGKKEQYLEGRVLSVDNLSQITFNFKPTGAATSGPNGAKPKTESTGLTKASGGIYTFRIQLSERLASGVNQITAEVRDSFGQITKENSFLILGKNTLADPTQPESVFFSQDLRYAQGQLPLKGESTFTLLYYSEISQTSEDGTTTSQVPDPISSLTFDPPTKDFELDHLANSYGGELITLKATNQGKTAVTKIKVTTASGKVYLTPWALTLTSDFEAPGLEITNPTQGFWAQGSLVLKGKVTGDITDLASKEYSLDGTNWQPLPANIVQEAPRVGATGGRTAVNFVKPTEDPSLINTKIDISGLPDGKLTLHLRTVDKAGNTYLQPIALFKDTVPPVLSLVAPEPGVKVNGLTSIIGEWTDGSRLATMEVSDDGKTWKALDSTAPRIKSDIDFSKYTKVPDKFLFRGTDLAGNATVFEGVFEVDLEVDKPQVNLQIPGPNEVLRSDFFISGLLLDDDGIKECFYRIDGKGEFIRVEASTSFQVPVSLKDITDTNHFVEVYAVDINGTKGAVQKQDFVVSRSGPTSVLVKPDLKITQKGKVILEGKSEDPNGVAYTQISFDNGNTFYNMRGSTDWSYLLDTSIVPDGIYTILIRAFDTTGATGDYSVLFSLDNTPPSLGLTSPKDGLLVAETLPLEGRGSDNVNLSRLSYSIKSLDSSTPAVSAELPIGQAFTTGLPLGGLKPGWYNLSVLAYDDAGNESILARNFQIADRLAADQIEIYFPVQGQIVSGPFQVQGRFISKNPSAEVSLTLGKTASKTAPVDANGYFSIALTPEDLLASLKEQIPGPGVSEAISLQITGMKGSVAVKSAVRDVEYRMQGPWVMIDSHSIGSYVTERPYMEGRLGYYTVAPPAVAEGEKPVTYLYGDKQITYEEIQRQPVKLELSMDNGVSFEPLGQLWDSQEKGVKSWKYRLQTQNFTQGDLTLLVKATFGDGSVATTRQKFTTDTIAPTVNLLVPTEEGHFNEVLKIVGAAFDDNGLKNVSVSLRKGDKVFTQVPSFIQGMYFDQSFMGATLWSTGLGVTFFDQAVKIQVNLGTFPETIPEAAGGGQAAFYGWVYGGKLLANVVSLPFGYFGGPDWEWLGVNMAVGANFSAFSKDMDAFVSDRLSIMGAIVGQVEVKANSSFNFLKAYSAYYEISSWFIPSEVKPRVEVQNSIGFRITLL